MKAAAVTIFVFSAITIINANLKIDSILGGTEVSLGSYYGSVTVGNVTKKLHKMEAADVKATKNAIELIRLLRRMFGVGIFTLPPLDPFTSNNLKPLTLGPDMFITGKVLLKSLTMTGAKHFDLKLLELHMKTGRINFEITFPEIHFNVNFETDTYLGGLIPLSVKGQLRGHISRPGLSGSLQTEVKLHKGQGPNVIYQISGATILVQANDMKVTLVNGMHLDNDLLQSVYDGADHSFLSRSVESTRDMIKEYAVNTFITQANKVLQSLSVAQVNAYLLPEDNL